MTEEKKEKKLYEAVKVPIDHELAIQTPDGDLINKEQLLATIANDIQEIKKNIVG